VLDSTVKDMPHATSRRLDPPKLYAALDRARTERGVSWQRLADETGVSSATIHRLREHGRFEADGIIALTAWLGQPVESFTRPGDLPPETIRGTR